MSRLSRDACPRPELPTNHRPNTPGPVGEPPAGIWANSTGVAQRCQGNDATFTRVQWPGLMTGKGLPSRRQLHAGGNKDAPREDSRMLHSKFRALLSPKMLTGKLPSLFFPKGSLPGTPLVQQVKQRLITAFILQVHKWTHSLQNQQTKAVNGLFHTGQREALAAEGPEPSTAQHFFANSYRAHSVLRTMKQSSVLVRIMLEGRGVQPTLGGELSWVPHSP